MKRFYFFPRWLVFVFTLIIFLAHYMLYLWVHRTDVTATDFWSFVCLALACGLSLLINGVLYVIKEEWRRLFAGLSFVLPLLFMGFGISLSFYPNYLWMGTGFILLFLVYFRYFSWKKYRQKKMLAEKKTQ